MKLPLHTFFIASLVAFALVAYGCASDDTTAPGGPGEASAEGAAEAEVKVRRAEELEKKMCERKAKEEAAKVSTTTDLYEESERNTRGGAKRGECTL